MSIVLSTMPIFLIRHGQTVWNVEKRLQGHLDSPLTSVGLAQAKRVGQFVSARIGMHDEYAIESSSLGRTMSTARVICAETGCESSQIMPDDNLKEANHGTWSGLTKVEVEGRFPGQIDERKNNHWTYRFPGGESYADLSNRAAVWWNKHRNAELEFKERILIVITHEMMSRCIRGRYLDLGPAKTLQLNHLHNCVFVLENGIITEHQLLK